MSVEAERDSSSGRSRWSHLSDHRRILRDVDYETAMPSSAEDSVDEEDDSGLAGDGQSIIGVSIGRAQTRLASPSATAAEKAAVLSPPGDRHDRETFNDEEQSERAPTTVDTDSASSVENQSLLERLPSPWRAGPKEFRILDGASFPPSNIAPNQVVARKKSFFSVPDGVQRRLMPFKIPSFPHLQMPNMTSVRSFGRTNDSEAQHAVENVLPSRELSSKINAEEMRQKRSSVNLPDRLFQPEGSSPRALMLRRSTSEPNFQNLERQMSTASSLGDDTRWQHVNAQINSRMRAIRDSWIDSNFKMPTMKDFTHLNFGAPWVEFPEDDHKLKKEIEQAPYRPQSTTHARNSSIPGTLAKEQGGTLPPARRMNKASAASHPHFMKALDDLTGDVIVLGGYRGSVLRSAKPPYRQLWVPVKVGLNLRKANLELGLNPEDEDNARDHIFPSGMLKNIGPVDISKRLFKRLRSSKHAVQGTLRVWDYGYDWRLSPHHLSRRLIEVIEDLPCNQPGVPASQRGAIVIAHSLGGLITRHAINLRPDLFAGVLYAGVPQNCVNILGPLRNGDDVLLSSRVLTAQVNFTIRTTFALLPLDGKCFVNQDTKEEYPVDFFDVKSWEEYRFSPCIARPLPPSSIPEPTGIYSTLVGSMTSVLPTTSRRNSLTKRKGAGIKTPLRSSSPPASSKVTPDLTSQSQGMNMQMNGKSNPQELGQNEETNISTAVTIPKADALAYLTRTLADVKKFKEDLAYRPGNAALYPPTAVLFGKSLPTVVGCGVKGREGIKKADAYENLTFASGDGVVLARAAQTPAGYKVEKGGVVSSDRGHISLLGDLEAVGRCLNVIMAGRKAGVGL